MRVCASFRWIAPPRQPGRWLITSAQAAVSRSSTSCALPGVTSKVVMTVWPSKAAVIWGMGWPFGP